MFATYMESSGGIASGDGSRSSFRAAARKLLAAVAPVPPPAPVVCRDVKTQMRVRCPNPRMMLIIVAGMSCMMVLVTIASALMCWYAVRQRRLNERHRAHHQQSQPEPSPELTGLAPPRTSSTTQNPAHSPEYDDAVLVQLPGDEKPHFFALPKPFPAKDEWSVKPEPDDVTDCGPKLDPPHDEPDTSDPCVLCRNPLFDSQ